MTRSSRKADRRALDFYEAQAGDVLRRHDPIGLIEMGAPDDEYDCVVSEVLIELMHERDLTLEAWLMNHFIEHFEVNADPVRVAAASIELQRLWRADELARLRT